MSSAAFKALFPVTRSLVYFNNAALGPLSTRAAEAMERHVRDQRDFGALHWRDWYAEHAKLRESAARLIGATAAEIAILKNTSEGLSFVAGGLTWREGDNVITTAIEFPSNWVPWKRLGGRGVETRVAALPTLAHIEPLVDARTRVVAVSSVAFHNGFVADLDAIGELCARRGILFCVDAIQSIGVLPMDVRRAKISVLAADGHKWMCGPEGGAIFYVAEEWRERIEPIEDGWTNIDRKGKFIDAGMEWLPDARRYEAGSPNTNGLHGLRAAMDLLLEIGVETIRAEAMKVATRLAEGLDSIGWRVVSSRPLHSPIVGATPPVVTPPNVEPTLLHWHRKLEENGIVCAPREGLLRFSPHFYNTLDEAERVVEVLRGGP
jgi:selenocysteine lyase/cysteine desulfurase